MKNFRKFYIVTLIYVGIYLLSIVPFFLRNTFDFETIDFLRTQGVIFNLLSYLSLGYIAYYFEERKWLMITFYGYASLLGVLFVFFEITSLYGTIITLAILFFTVLFIVACFNVRNTFIKRYFKTLGIMTIISRFINAPKNSGETPTSLLFLLPTLLKIVPVLIIMVMLKRIMDEIKQMDKEF